jgi:hypothetical protein
MYNEILIKAKPKSKEKVKIKEKFDLRKILHLFMLLKVLH